MMTLPHITTARTRLTVLPPERACLMLDFYQRNRVHLAPWEPRRDESFYTLGHWQGRLRDGYGQFFDGSAVPLVALDPKGERVLAPCHFTHIMMGMFKACHLGYAIDQAHEGQGLMQEVVAAGIDYLFRERGLHRIMAGYMPANRRLAGASRVRAGRLCPGLPDDQRPLGGPRPHRAAQSGRLGCMWVSPCGANPSAQAVLDPCSLGFVGFFTTRSHYLCASHTPDPKSV
ncbi:ribosomal-protein-alanine N-acetyltransferase [Aeromonas media WS]|nr:ribosomal-protein-alanine N-acetyltransferase [Aeromonas media WS]